MLEHHVLLILLITHAFLAVPLRVKVLLILLITHAFLAVPLRVNLCDKSIFLDFGFLAEIDSDPRPAQAAMLSFGISFRFLCSNS